MDSLKAGVATAASTSTPNPRSRRGNRHQDGLSLPWLPDRFYVNVIAGARDGREQQGRGGGGIEAGYGDSSGRDGGRHFFSLERLVEVVTGDGWPGIKAAVFGTFSVDMR